MSTASTSVTEEAPEKIFEKHGWKQAKQLTPQEHWLLSDFHKKNWHGKWVRYIATPSETGEATYSIQEAKYGIRYIKWVDSAKTESAHQNYYFTEGFEPLPGAGPWRNTVTESTLEGVAHSASNTATTLYLPDGNIVWSSKAVDLDAKVFSVAAELFLAPDESTRVSMVAFYKGESFAGVTLIREEARESPDTLELQADGKQPFWTYEKELPQTSTDSAAELIGTEKVITTPGLHLLEREGRFGGIGGSHRDLQSDTDVEAFGPSMGDVEYEVIRLPENLSLRCPKRLVQGRGFEVAAALVTADGMRASQCKVMYGSDWKLKGLVHGTYIA